MPELSEISKWFEQYPRMGWLLLFIYIVFDTVRHRINNAEPGVFRSLLTFRKRQFEHMIKQPYLNKKAIRLAKCELRQRSLYKLTGLFNYRLQDLAVVLCDRYGLRAGYLKPWRDWLKEENGKIVFSKKWYKFRWRLFLIIQVINALMAMIVIVIIYKYSSLELIAPLFAVFVVAWWFPLLMISAVPHPKFTREMEAYLLRFNDEQTSAV